MSEQTDDGAVLLGTAGDDVFTYDLLADSITLVDGGEGFDKLAPGRSWWQVSVDLSAVTLVGIEEIHGSTGADVIIGSAGDDVIVGNGGGKNGDRLDGGAGDDVFIVSNSSGTGGGHEVLGGEGFDEVRGTAGDDLIMLRGFSADNSVERIDGGDGFDVLRAGQPWGDNSIDLRGIEVASIERIEGGTGGDTIYGSDGDDVIAGLGGNDTIFGGGGTDKVLFAGAQADYTVTRTSDDQGTVRDADGRTTTVNGVETLAFSDSEVSFSSLKIAAVVAGCTACTSLDPDMPDVSKDAEGRWYVESVAELRLAIDRANEGDTIVMQAGDYDVYGLDYRWDTPEAEALRAEVGLPESERTWNTSSIEIDKSLTFVSHGEGRANLNAVSNMPHGIFKIEASAKDVTVDGFGFFGNKGLWNSSNAGLWHNGGGLTVQNSEFGNNNNGILAQAQDSRVAGDILVEDSVFWGAGNSGLQHNIYVYSKSLVVLDSEFSNSHLGHHIKSLSSHTVVRGNRIDDGDEPGGRSIDITGGGTVLIEDNTMIKSAESDNRDFIFYAGYRKGGETGEVVIQNNTFVNQGVTGAFVVANQSDVQIEFLNNIIEDSLMLGEPTDLVATGLSSQVGNSLNGDLLPDRGPLAGFAAGTAGDDVVALGNGVSYDASTGKDTVFTGQMLNRVYGGEGDDVLVASLEPGVYDGKKADALFGGPGADLIYSRNGQPNLLSGDEGDDVLWGGDGVGEALYGGPDNDIIYGGEGEARDYLNGGAGNDILIAGGSSKVAQRLMAGSGNDILVGGSGADDYSGGDGIDTIVYSGNFADYEMHIIWGYRLQIYTMNSELFHEFRHDGTGRNNGQSFEEYVPPGVEQIQFADGIYVIETVQGSDGRYQLGEGQFLPGEQVIDVPALLAGLEDAPDRSVATGTVVEGEDPAEPNDGGADNPEAPTDGTSDPGEPDAGSGDGTGLTGTAGDDVFTYDLLTDSITLIDGGAGFDKLAPGRSWWQVSVDLSAVTLAGIEEIHGGTSDDQIIGSAGDDVIVANGGGKHGDRLDGGAGDDVFIVSNPSGKGGGHEVLGGDGFDEVRGTAGDDLIMLRGFSAANGVERIDGGDGVDVLRAGQPWGDNSIDLRGVEVVGIERIEGGTGDDTIYGSDGDDVIAGLGGSDTVFGGAGADRFVVGFDDNARDRLRVADFDASEDLLALQLVGTQFEGATVAELESVHGWSVTSSAGGNVVINHAEGAVELDGLVHDTATDGLTKLAPMLDMF